MPIQKVMEILDHFETQALRDIQRDHRINADPYESVGKHILIVKIKKKIQTGFDPHEKEAA
jgi:hypothetical protein